ncbi:uncharacterized protein LOC124545200 isoform X1 [Schistocerca americana]|uniref:uncharacterized protein LOC124545200 isoform X1 n=2 Tax=Schistocerca americana TaxID=7009 RepID=UPI001F502FED|nr:uncharacterized protein LOC124545200 isoform X1 [Schistocerca americana]
MYVFTDPMYSYPLPKDDSQKVSCHGDNIDHGSQIVSQQQNETKKIESYETDYDRIKQTLNCIKMLYHSSGGNSLSKMIKKAPNAKSRKSSNRNKRPNDPSEDKQPHLKSASEGLIAEELDTHKEGRQYQETNDKQIPVALSKSEEIGSESKMFNNAECNTDAPLEVTHIQKRKDIKSLYHDLQPNPEKESTNDPMNDIQAETQKSGHAIEKNYLMTKSEVAPMDTTDSYKEERQVHKNKNRKTSKTFTMTSENSSEPITELTKIPNLAQSEASSERLELHGPKNNKFSNNLSQLYAEKRITSDTLTSLLADIHNNVHKDSKLNVSIEESRRKFRSRKIRDRHQMRYENVERYIASMVSEENTPERETDDILLNKQSLPEEAYDRGEEESSNFLENNVFDNPHDFVCGPDHPRNLEEQYLSKKSRKQKMTKSHNAHSVGSADTLQTATPKKKNKHKKNEKKRNNAGHCTLPVKQKGKINEDVLSVTTKPKKKKVNKLKITDSRNTIGFKPESGGDRDRFSPTESFSTTQVPCKLWPTDNVVELYHNAAAKPGATKSNVGGHQKPERDIKIALPKRPAKMMNQKLANLTQKVKKLNEYVINEDKLQEEMENIELLGSIKSDRTHTQDGTEENQPNAPTDNSLSLHDFSESPGEMMTVEVIKQKIPASKPFKKVLKSSKNYEIQRRKTRTTPNVQHQDASPVPPKDMSLITSKKKNFQLPTLSSQSKHICSGSLQKFDFHTIPFVVGTSITPSHNLGLNIQQTLSIMKLHRPSSGQSPMELANVFLREKQHTLAGDHLRPVLSLHSKLTACSEWQSCCPALMRCSDTSDEPTKEKAQADCQDSLPPNEKCLETGKQPENPWSLDENSNKSHAHCTCYPSPPCTDFQSLLSAYLEGGSKCSISEKSRVPYSGLKLQNFRLRNHPNFPKIPRMNSVLNNIGQLCNGREDVDAIPTKENGIVHAAETLASSKQERTDHAYLRHLTDQNKSLKDVLLNLHSDFVRLNNKYEELKITSKNDQGKNTEVLKELQEVEAELEAKEDEITVLMNLYEEVTVLKRQTKALMQRVSNPSLATAGKEGRRTGPRETSVAFLLTRLLRSIQRIQDKLRED